MTPAMQTLYHKWTFYIHYTTFNGVCTPIYIRLFLCQSGVQCDTCETNSSFYTNSTPYIATHHNAPNTKLFQNVYKYKYHDCSTIRLNVLPIHTSTCIILR